VLPEIAVAIQLTLVVAVHVQPVPAVTVKLPLPPLAATEVELDESAYEQVALAPACVTVNVWPPTAMWPVRELVPVLAVTV
jgi:hypothetical protein